MKEIKLCDLTKEEIKEAKVMLKLREKIGSLIIQHESMLSAFWVLVKDEHSLFGKSAMYIKDNTVCCMDRECSSGV